MAGAAPGGVPQLEQVAGRPAGRGDDGVAGLRLLVQGVDELALAHRLAFAADEHLLLHPPRPATIGGDDLGAVSGRLPEPGGCRGPVQGEQGFAGIRDEWQRALLDGVVSANVDADEADQRVVETGLRARGEVRQPGPDTQDEVRLANNLRRRAGPLQSVTPQAQVGRPAQCALAGKGLGDRDTERLREPLELVPGLGVVDAPTGEDDRASGLLEQGRRLLDAPRIGGPSFNAPGTLLEEASRVVVRVRLHVLRQGQGDRPGLGRVGEHAHRLGQGGQQLFGPGDAVEESAHRAEAVVDAHVGRDRMFELLQDRPLVGVA